VEVRIQTLHETSSYVFVYSTYINTLYKLTATLISPDETDTLWPHDLETTFWVADRSRYWESGLVCRCVHLCSVAAELWFGTIELTVTPVMSKTDGLSRRHDRFPVTDVRTAVGRQSDFAWSRKSDHIDQHSALNIRLLLVTAHQTCRSMHHVHVVVRCTYGVSRVVKFVLLVSETSAYIAETWKSVEVGAALPWDQLSCSMHARPVSVPRLICHSSTSPGNRRVTGICKSHTNFHLILNIIVVDFISPSKSLASLLTYTQPCHLGNTSPVVWNALPVHTSAQHPSVKDNSELGWKPMSSTKPTTASENILF